MENNGMHTFSNVSRILILLLLLIVSPLSTAAKPQQVAIVISNTSAVYLAVTEEIKAYIGNNIELTVVDISKTQYLPEYTPTYLTVGTQAFQKVLTEKPEATIIASFIPRRTYETLISEQKKQHTTAIFVDQPMSRQVKLVRLIMPNAKTIGTVFGASSIEERKLLYEAANNANFSIISDTLNADDNPLAILQPIISKADMFLALPDQSVFNKATAKWSLYITLHDKKPLIGFSEKYVEAGALAAVYSTPVDIGKDAYNTLAKYLKTNVLPDAHHPTDFSVKTNSSSARALNIELPPDNILIQKLKEAE